MKKKSRVTNQLQARHLSERIGAKQRKARAEIYELEKKRKEPPAVRQARAMVKQWDDSEYKSKRQIIDRSMLKLDAAANKTREQILFAEPADALKAVQEFERYAVTA